MMHWNVQICWSLGKNKQFSKSRLPTWRSIKTTSGKWIQCPEVMKTCSSLWTRSLSFLITTFLHTSLISLVSIQLYHPLRTNIPFTFGSVDQLCSVFLTDSWLQGSQRSDLESTKLLWQQALPFSCSCSLTCVCNSLSPTWADTPNAIVSPLAMLLTLKSSQVLTDKPQKTHYMTTLLVNAPWQTL